MSHGGRASGWVGRSRSRLRDQERIKFWEEMGVVDCTFSCDVSLVNRPLDLRSGPLGWALRWEMVRGIRMNGGAGP